MNGSWNFTSFIARKLQKQHSDPAIGGSAGRKAARPITRIATLSIALAMIVNIITIAVVQGFQQEVRRKVTGFGSHISIQKSGEGTIYESLPLQLDPGLLKTLASIPGIQSVQPVAYKPALLQSVAEEEQREILGVVMKGVDASYDWAFIKENLKEGRIPDFKKNDSQEILVSASICRDLHYKLGDTARAYFVKQQPVLRTYRIVGIYETGLEDFDKEMVFCQLSQVQAMNDWGMQATVVVDDTLSGGDLIVRGDVSGGNGNYRFDWGKGYERYAGFTICPVKDTVIRLIASDYWNRMDEPAGTLTDAQTETAIPDTSYLKITVKGNRYSPCIYRKNDDGTLAKRFLDHKGFVYELDAGEKTVRVEMIPGKGSFAQYAGSYECMVSDWDQLDAVKDRVAKNVMFRPEMHQQVQVKSIKDLQNELFVWLGFLDINMAIILTLMLIIGIINMGSALLVMILVRTSFIGIMKAMGATNWTIRNIFVAQAGGLILRGMIWGNVIGVGFCLLQEYFGIFSLDPKVYYLNKVPVSISPLTILALNGFTFVVCLTALIAPSVVITRIRPSKAIRFR
jgi:lipoprotein-releasing system permease protein